MTTPWTNISTTLIFSDHSPVLRLIPTAKIAVIMVHGIVSTPRHFDFIMPILPSNCSVHNLLLAGHGGTHKDFAKASMKQWKTQVEQALLQLEETHETIIGIGFSLGSLLLMEASRSHPKLQQLILLNPPLRPKFPLTMLWQSLRYIHGRVRSENPVELATFLDIGCQLKPGIWRYLSWLPRFAELLIFCHQCRREISRIPVPCQVFLSQKDEMVRHKTQQDFFKLSHAKCRIFARCTHCYYTKEFQQAVIDCVTNLLNDEALPIVPEK